MTVSRTWQVYTQNFTKEVQLMKILFHMTWKYSFLPNRDIKCQKSSIQEQNPPSKSTFRNLSHTGQISPKSSLKSEKRYGNYVRRISCTILLRFILILWGKFDHLIEIWRKTMIFCHVRDTFQHTNFGSNPAFIYFNWSYATFGMSDNLSIDLVAHYKSIWGMFCA